MVSSGPHTFPVTFLQTLEGKEYSIAVEPREGQRCGKNRSYALNPLDIRTRSNHYQIGVLDVHHKLEVTDYLGHIK
jgi:hypothetical protein